MDQAGSFPAAGNAVFGRHAGKSRAVNTQKIAKGSQDSAAVLSRLLFFSGKIRVVLWVLGLIVHQRGKGIVGPLLNRDLNLPSVIGRVRNQKRNAARRVPLDSANRPLRARAAAKPQGSHQRQYKIAKRFLHPFIPSFCLGLEKRTSS